MPAQGSEGNDKHFDKGFKLAVMEPAVVYQVGSCLESTAYAEIKRRLASQASA
jgi:hypothetical protein